MKCLVWIAITILALLLIVGGVMASQLNLSALPEPDKTETFIASKAKHYLVRRASRVGIPPALTDMQASRKGTNSSARNARSATAITDEGQLMREDGCIHAQRI